MIDLILDRLLLFYINILVKGLCIIYSKYNVKINYIYADLAKAEDISTLWQQVTELYREGVDILVNCAGK